MWYKNGIKFSSYKRCSFQQDTSADLIGYCPKIIKKEDNLILGQNSAIRPIVQTANWMTCASKMAPRLQWSFSTLAKVDMVKITICKCDFCFVLFDIVVGKFLPFELFLAMFIYQTLPKRRDKHYQGVSKWQKKSYYLFTISNFARVENKALWFVGLPAWTREMQNGNWVLG